jgi:hypothetical protein
MGTAMQQRPHMSSGGKPCSCVDTVRCPNESRVRPRARRYGLKKGLGGRKRHLARRCALNARQVQRPARGAGDLIQCAQ